MLLFKKYIKWQHLMEHIDCIPTIGMVFEYEGKVWEVKGYDKYFQKVYVTKKRQV